MPSVGAKVRVTTQHPNNYYLATGFVTNMYEGAVLPTEKHDKPLTFNMTGNERTRLRNIALVNVVRIEYLKGKPMKTDVRAFKVKSGDKEYTVTVINGKVDCTCLGFTYRHKCKHSDGVKAKIQVK